MRIMSHSDIDIEVNNVLDVWGTPDAVEAELNRIDRECGWTVCAMVIREVLRRVGERFAPAA